MSDQQQISAFTKRIVDRFADLETRGERSLTEIVEDEFRKMQMEIVANVTKSMSHRDFNGYFFKLLEILNG